MIDNACVVYTNGSQECERVCALLKHLGGEYHEYRFTPSTPMSTVNIDLTHSITVLIMVGIIRPLLLIMCSLY